MNVVIFINDQHAHDVLGCAGFGELETPAADRLAADGIRFTQATCNCTPCLPSRHNLFHGLHSCQTGVYTNGDCLPLDMIPSLTMGKLFKEAGYETAAFGKMHWFPYHARVERGNYFGFDHRAAHFHETGESMSTHFVKEHRDLVEARLEEWTAHGIGQGGDDCAAAFLGFTSKLRNDERCDWWSAQRAASFVDVNCDRPFLLVCSLIGPHAPHDVPADLAHLCDPEKAPMPPEWRDDLPDARAYEQFRGLARSDLKTAVANYMAYVTATDLCHHRMLDALDRNGLYEDSLIIYLSDHGELLGSRGVTAFSKYNLYERSIRIPLIVKPPKGLDSSARGATSDSLVSLVDILPTVLDVAGLPVHDSLPGLNLRPLLEGQQLEREREVAFTEFARGGRVHLSIRARDWKLILGPHGEELYHLAEDPVELENLAADSTCLREKEELKGRFIEEYRSVFWQHGNRNRGYATQDWGQLTL